MTDMTMSIDLMGNYTQDMVGFHIKKKKIHYASVLYVRSSQVGNSLSSENLFNLSS